MTAIRTVLTTLVVGFIAPHALSQNSLSEAISAGTPDLDFRYRYEGVDQAGFANKGSASTLKSRFTWTSGEFSAGDDGNLVIGLQFDHVTAIDSEHFNSTVNGRTQYPVVADPKGLDLNLSFIKYGFKEGSATFGRQRILLGNQRFVGGVAWRQNEQTYDSLRFEFKPADDFTFDYAYVWNVNRIFGPDDGAQPSTWNGNTHLLTLNWSVDEHHEFYGFRYLFDLENDNGPPFSNTTFGAGYNGSLGSVSLTAAIARQSGSGDNPHDYNANYHLLEASIDVSQLTIKAGLEQLGSGNDGVTSFRTPLATLHKFQGWTDKFLVTPVNGVEDIYVSVSGKAGSVSLAATFHDFNASLDGSSYGSELDLVATIPLGDKTSLQFKYADYNEDGFATDTQKFWITLTFNP